MKTSVAFLLLAALIALASAQHDNNNFFNEKSGRCPRKPYNCDHKPGGLPCRRDSDCRGSWKCCDVCGLTCTEPETERPDKEEKSGRCPRKPYNCDYKPGGPPCRRDSDCRGSRKCCDVCGLTCTEPETERPDKEEKSGRCPRKPYNCDHKPGGLPCRRDSDCRGSRKCCDVCGLTCTEPETERPDKEEKSGRCPRKPYNCDHKPGGLPCRRDSDCRGSRKCCDVCGLTCTEPETERPDKEEHPGKCPREPDRCRPGSKPKPSPECKIDGDCGRKQKCCESCGVVECVDVSEYH